MHFWFFLIQGSFLIRSDFFLIDYQQGDILGVSDATLLMPKQLSQEFFLFCLEEIAKNLNPIARIVFFQIFADIALYFLGLQ